jgi:hypothetical protein
MKIYQTVEPVPSRIEGLLRLLRPYGKQGVTREALLELLQPTTIRSKDDADRIGTNTLLALRQLSSADTPLIVEWEDERGEPRVSLGQHLTRLQPEKFKSQILTLLERAALRPTVDGDQNQFGVVCAWLMWQTPTGMPQGHAALKTRMQSDGLDYEGLGLSNDARWDVVVYWATYFGLLWQYLEDKCFGLVPDPTTFLLRHLDDLLPRQGVVPIHEFKVTLGNICPVLDGGVLHAAVADVLAQKGAISPDNRMRVSPALSLALRNLSEEGALRYWCPDDQRLFQIMSQDEKIAFVERSA